mmetsp:Transcript_2541/g.6351  ORF Transcript_2541/g.6351 Transcript_2541/m.6351 type:complete len:201 (-) Transcript_2541:42-644(-)
MSITPSSSTVVTALMLTMSVAARVSISPLPYDNFSPQSATDAVEDLDLSKQGSDSWHDSQWQPGMTKSSLPVSAIASKYCAGVPMPTDTVRQSPVNVNAAQDDCSRPIRPCRRPTCNPLCSKATWSAFESPRHAGVSLPPAVAQAPEPPPPAATRVAAQLVKRRRKFTQQATAATERSGAMVVVQNVKKFGQIREMLAQG